MNEENKSQEPIDEPVASKEIKEEIKAEVIDDMELEDLVPKMEVKGGPDDQPECIVGDESLISLYEEILDNSRADRGQADEILADFINMVMNSFHNFNFYFLFCL